MDCKHENISGYLAFNIHIFQCDRCKKKIPEDELGFMLKTRYQLTQDVVELSDKQLVYEVLDNYPNGDKRMRCCGCNVEVRVEIGTLFNSNEFPHHKFGCLKGDLNKALTALKESEDG